MSKDLKPKQRLGQGKRSRLKSMIGWVAFAIIGGGGAFAAYRYTTTTKVEVQAVRVRRADFVIAVRTRGEIKSTNSTVISAPQVPQLQIVRLAESGKAVKKGDVVVEFDAAQQEQNVLDRNTAVRTVDSEIVQMQASHKMTNEGDATSLLKSQFNVQRSQLEASKAEVVSEIEGAKSRIDVGLREGELGQVKTSINSHQVSQKADLQRLEQRKDKSVRDLDRTQDYLTKMVLRAPTDGIVNILPNFRTQGSYGSSPPPFKAGDSAWTGAPIAEIPDLSSMRIELNLDEVDRGKLQIGQKVKVKVDALPDRELMAELTWISPIASVTWRGMGLSDKSFPAHATLKDLDPRLRPGMSATAEILLESQPNVLMIPLKANFTSQGKPAVYVQQGSDFVLRPIEVGKRNENDMVVLKGLKEGDMVAVENPAEAAKRAKKF